jgi:hypothetical protein
MGADVIPDGPARHVGRPERHGCREARGGLGTGGAANADRNQACLSHQIMTTMQLHELLGQRQTEPCTLLLAGVVAADLVGTGRPGRRLGEGAEGAR